MIIKGKLLKQAFEEYLINRIEGLNMAPILSVVIVGDNLASKTYVQIKEKIGKKIGLKVNIYHYDNNIDRQDFIDQYKKIQNSSDGFIFQLPLPSHLADLYQDIPPNIDVDMLNHSSSDLWDKGILPPTIGAVDIILKFIQNSEKTYYKKPLIDIDYLLNESKLEDKNYLIIGKGVLVGKPMSEYFRRLGLRFNVVTKSTKKPKEIAKSADTIITATGQECLINQSWLNGKTTLVDCATSESNNTLVGDLDYSNLDDDNIIVPSPGGIGRLTVLYLFYNLIRLYEMKTNTI